jgi:hypothetical protein
MDMWTMRLRRTGRSRGQRHALPTAAPFAHMPTAFYWQESNEESDNIALVTFLCEATRPANLIVANHYVGAGFGLSPFHQVCRPVGEPV